MAFVAASWSEYLDKRDLVPEVSEDVWYTSIFFSLFIFILFIYYFFVFVFDIVCHTIFIRL